MFAGLWLRIFSVGGQLLDDADPNAIYFLRQLSSAFKKLNLGALDDVKCKEKENGFIHTEKDLRAPTKRWRYDDLYGADTTSLSVTDICDTDDLWSTGTVCSDEGSRYSRLSYVQEVFDFFCGDFDRVDTIELDNRMDCKTPSCKHGPGATNKTSRYVDKFNISEVSFNNLFLMSEFPTFETIYNNDCQLRVYEPSSRLIFVPKDNRGPRLIAAEPIVNQYFQQGIFSFIQRDVLRNTLLGKFVNFSRQDLSQDLARRASIDSSLATIDLKDASDRLTCWLVERAFARSPLFLNYCFSSRSNSALLHFSKDIISLKKYATQGNATTFPIQSVVYAMIAIASVLHDNRLQVTDSNIRKLGGRVRVFGDDIIIPNGSYDTATANLVDLGLVVNESKSFHTGHFRESCGGDFYKGYDVTPIKFRRKFDGSPEAKQMMIDVSNDAYFAGLWHLSDALVSLFPHKNREHNMPLVPIRKVSVSSGSGLMSYSSSYNFHLDSRWDTKLHCIQLKHWTVSLSTNRVHRTTLSRLAEQQLRDITSPDWKPSRIQRSQSIDKIGWF